MRAGALLALGLVAGACTSGGSPGPARGGDVEPDEPSPGGGAPGGDATSPSTTGPAKDAGGDATTRPRPYVHFDVNHVLSTGQSNSIGNDAQPPLSSTQPYANLMFDSGVMTSGGCERNGCTRYQKPSALVPLVEGDSFFYPVETMSSGMANAVTKLATARDKRRSHDLLVSVHGRNGYNYLCLRKGGCDWWGGAGYIHPFDEGMMEVADGKRLAEAQGKSYVVRAVTAIHGEHDHYADSGGYSYFPMPRTDGAGTVHDYGEALEEWQRDYEAGVKAITKQSLPVPLFINQYSHWNDVEHTKIAFLQLDAHVRSAGNVVIVGPTYRLPYTESCLHFSSDGERWLGEYFAKAYARVVIEGLPWEPLRPIRATLAGNVVTIDYLVPVPPVVLDTDLVPDPGGHGFEVFDGTASPPAIESVSVAGPTTLKVVLSSAPAGASPRIRYAYTYRHEGCAGGVTRTARGNVRDSDKTPSEHGYDLYNWSVHFDMPLR